MCDPFGPQSLEWIRFKTLALAMRFLGSELQSYRPGSDDMGASFWARVQAAISVGSATTRNTRLLNTTLPE